MNTRINASTHHSQRRSFVLAGADFPCRTGCKSASAEFGSAAVQNAYATSRARNPCALEPYRKRETAMAV